MSDSSEPIDLDQLIEELEAGTNEAAKLAREIRETATPSLKGDSLIREVAEDLSEIRKVTGLPPKSARQFEEQIRMQPELGSSADE